MKRINSTTKDDIKKMINNTKKEISNSPVYIVSSKNKKIGLSLIAGPILLLNIVLEIYTAVKPTETDPGPLSPGTLDVVMIILASLGLVFFIGMMIGIPLGIKFLKKRELVNNTK
jgi:hypothetical protein